MRPPDEVAAGFPPTGHLATSSSNGAIGGHAREQVAPSKATGPGRREGILRARCVPRRRPQPRPLRLLPLPPCRLGCFSSPSVLCWFVRFTMMRSTAVHDRACPGDYSLLGVCSQGGAPELELGAGAGAGTDVGAGAGGHLPSATAAAAATATATVTTTAAAATTVVVPAVQTVHVALPTDDLPRLAVAFWAQAKGQPRGLYPGRAAKGPTVSLVP